MTDETNDLTRESTPEELQKLEAYIVKITDHMNNPEKCWEEFERVFSKLSPKHQHLCTRLNHAINVYVTT